MYFVGLDLAWGQRKPTGVAVVDDSGRLVSASAATDDASIRAAVATYTEGECVVGIDAPIVVTNPNGQRPAERALNADFARFQAGAHPSNTGKPEFAHGTRAGRLANDLDLDIDPRGGRPRRAIEVYPHAATVALFRLGRTLKYKAKQGRSGSLRCHAPGRVRRESATRLSSPIGRVFEVAVCDQHDEAEATLRQARKRQARQLGAHLHV